MLRGRRGAGRASEPISPIAHRCRRGLRRHDVGCWNARQKRVVPRSYRAASNMVQKSIGHIEESGSQLTPAFLRCCLDGTRLGDRPSPSSVVVRLKGPFDLPLSLAASASFLPPTAPASTVLRVATTISGRLAIIKVRQM